MIKLFLSKKDYPNAFAKHGVPNPISGNKETFFELRLIDVLNKKNEKLNIEKVEYVDLKSEFNLQQKRSGVIVKEDASGVNVLAYVFLSTEEGRNIFVGQTIFPDLIDKIEEYIDSPSFTLANHPIYFINMVVDINKVTAGVKKDLALLELAGIHHVDFFKHNISDIKNIPNNITDFVNSYMIGLKSNKKGLKPINFRLNLQQREFTIHSTAQILKNKSEFDGSKEKFFFTEILFSSILAIKSGFQINFSDLDSFINNFKAGPVATSQKMNRCKTLLKILKKLQYKINYHEL